MSRFFRQNISFIFGLLFCSISLFTAAPQIPQSLEELARASSVAKSAKSFLVAVFGLGTVGEVDYKKIVRDRGTAWLSAINSDMRDLQLASLRADLLSAYYMMTQEFLVKHPWFSPSTITSFEFEGYDPILGTIPMRILKKYRKELYATAGTLVGILVFAKVRAVMGDHLGDVVSHSINGVLSDPKIQGQVDRALDVTCNKFANTVNGVADTQLRSMDQLLQKHERSFDRITDKKIRTLNHLVFRIMRRVPKMSKNATQEATAALFERPEVQETLHQIRAEVKRALDEVVKTRKIVKKTISTTMKKVPMMAKKSTEEATAALFARPEVKATLHQTNAKVKRALDTVQKTVDRIGNSTLGCRLIGPKKKASKPEPSSIGWFTWRKNPAVKKEARVVANDQSASIVVDSQWEDTQRQASATQRQFTFRSKVSKRRKRSTAELKAFIGRSEIDYSGCEVMEDQLPMEQALHPLVELQEPPVLPLPASAEISRFAALKRNCAVCKESAIGGLKTAKNSVTSCLKTAKAFATLDLDHLAGFDEAEEEEIPVIEPVSSKGSAPVLQSTPQPVPQSNPQ